MVHQQRSLMSGSVVADFEWLNVRQLLVSAQKYMRNFITLIVFFCLSHRYIHMLTFDIESRMEHPNEMTYHIIHVIKAHIINQNTVRDDSNNRKQSKSQCNHFNLHGRTWFGKIHDTHDALGFLCSSAVFLVSQFCFYLRSCDIPARTISTGLAIQLFIHLLFTRDLQTNII